MQTENGTATHFHTCPLCEATCGLEINLQRLRRNRNIRLASGNCTMSTVYPSAPRRGVEADIVR